MADPCSAPQGEDGRLDRLAEEWMDRKPKRGESVHRSLTALLRSTEREALEKAAKLLEGLHETAAGAGSYRQAAAAIRREMWE